MDGQMQAGAGCFSIPFDVPPYRFSGPLYVALLNHRSALAARAAVANPDALAIRTYLDGALMQTASTADLIRPAARLLADVTDFMTLAPGDVLALGAAGPAPRASSGGIVTIEIDGLGSLRNPFMEAPA